jgi:hypothetical protein
MYPGESESLPGNVPGTLNPGATQLIGQGRIGHESEIEQV